MSEKRHYGKENYAHQEEVLGTPELTADTNETTKSSEAEKDNQEKKINVKEVRERLLEQPDIPLELPYDDSPEGNQPQYIDRKVKAKTLKKELEEIRSNLSLTQKVLSKVIHQQTISKLSDIGAKTIARPSGLLGGGILAFCGSLIYLLFTKYVGMKYNYLIFIFLFLSGYLITLATEFLIRSFRRQK